ncbi:Mitotic spindle assembly checkpoint protein MAD2B [Triplophysa tibetana]|uniref:Mitotic spindle assembly checkpoint protein MAD2B n=1 Tax=Triplophysa tibetana TaxID=1572043 RepID=A0A5A9NWX8_9TELE|nr:Mitotic spindle assembly checkpoint protein MAD2B [Triplophysa tibetana]
MSREEEHMSREEEHMSRDEEHMSSEAEHMSTVEEHLSREEEYMSREEEHMSREEEHMSREEEHMSTEAEHMSSEEEHMSREEEHMSREEEHMSTEEHMSVALEISCKENNRKRTNNFNISLEVLSYTELSCEKFLCSYGLPVLESITENEAEKVVVVIMDKEHHPVESSDTLLSHVEQLLRAVILKISVCDAVLDNNPPGCTFTVLVHTRGAATRNMEKVQVINETVFIGIAQKIPVQLVFRALNQLTLITPMALFNVFPALCVMQEGFYCNDKNKDSCTLAVKHIECRPGQYIKQAGTAYTDTTCANCSDGFYSNGTLLACQPHSKCSIKGLIEIKAGTTSTDAECGKSSPVGLVIGVTVGVSYIAQPQNDLEPGRQKNTRSSRNTLERFDEGSKPTWRPLDSSRSTSKEVEGSVCPSPYPGRLAGIPVSNPAVKDGLSETLQDFQNADMDEVLSVLSSHNCSMLPNENNLRKILEEIAHEEMALQQT